MNPFGYDPFNSKPDKNQIKAEKDAFKSEESKRENLYKSAGIDYDKDRDGRVFAKDSEANRRIGLSAPVIGEDGRVDLDSRREVDGIIQSIPQTGEKIKAAKERRSALSEIAKGHRASLDAFDSQWGAKKVKREVWQDDLGDGIGGYKDVEDIEFEGIDDEDRRDALMQTRKAMLEEADRTERSIGEIDIEIGQYHEARQKWIEQQRSRLGAKPGDIPELDEQRDPDVEIGSPEWYQRIEAHGGVVGGGKKPPLPSPLELANGQIVGKNDPIPQGDPAFHRTVEGQGDGVTAKVTDEFQISQADVDAAQAEQLGYTVNPDGTMTRSTKVSPTEVETEQEKPKFLMGERVESMREAGARPLEVANVLSENAKALRKHLKRDLSPEQRAFTESQFEQNAEYLASFIDQLSEKERKDLDPGVVDRALDLFQSGASAASSYGYSGIAGLARAADIGSQWLDNTFFGDSYEQGEGMFPQIAQLAQSLSRDSESFGVGEVAQGRMENQISGVLLGQLPSQMALTFVSGPSSTFSGASKLMRGINSVANKAQVGLASMWGAMFDENISEAEQTMMKSFDQMTPEERNKAAKSAIVGATAQTALERAGIGIVLGQKIFKGSKQLSTDKFLEGFLGKGTFGAFTKSFLGEGFTETGQEALKDAVAKFFYDADRDLWDEESVMDRLKVFFIGGVAGGAAGGARSAFQQIMGEQAAQLPEDQQKEMAAAIEESYFYKKARQQVAQELGPVEFSELTPEQQAELVEAKREEMGVSDEELARVRAATEELFNTKPEPESGLKVFTVTKNIPDVGERKQKVFAKSFEEAMEMVQGEDGVGDFSIESEPEVLTEMVPTFVFTSKSGEEVTIESENPVEARKQLPEGFEIAAMRSGEAVERPVKVDIEPQSADESSDNTDTTRTAATEQSVPVPPAEKPDDGSGEPTVDSDTGAGPAPELSTVQVDLGSLSDSEVQNVKKQLRQKLVNAREAEKAGRPVVGGTGSIESDYNAVSDYLESRKQTSESTQDTPKARNPDAAGLPTDAPATERSGGAEPEAELIKKIKSAKSREELVNAQGELVKSLSDGDRVDDKTTGSSLVLKSRKKSKNTGLETITLDLVGEIDGESDVFLDAVLYQEQKDGSWKFLGSPDGVLNNSSDFSVRRKSKDSKQPEPSAPKARKLTEIKDAFKLSERGREAVDLIGDAIERVVGPDAFEKVKIDIVPASEMPEGFADRGGVWDRKTSRLLLNRDAVDNQGDGAILSVFHESGHVIAEAMDDFIRDQWASLTPEQREAAKLEYNPDDTRTDAQLLASKNARQEWFNFQLFRVAREGVETFQKDESLPKPFKDKVVEAWNEIRKIITKWIGDESLSTEALDTRIREILFGEAVSNDTSATTQRDAGRSPQGEGVTPEGESTSVPTNLTRDSLMQRVTSTGAIATEQDISVSEIVVNKDIPQFKEDADPVTGVVEGQQLQGKYDVVKGGRIVVWEKENGEKEVITGRHRLDLAKRTNTAKIPAFVFKESDGFTVQDAMVLDAEFNIADGQGKVKDYAHYFKTVGEGISREEATQRGLLSRLEGRQGWSLGRESVQGLFDLYANNQIAEPKAAAIAAAAPGNEAAQMLAAKQAMANRSLSAEQLRFRTQQIARMGGIEGKSSDQMGLGDLMGSDDFQRIEAEAAKVGDAQAEMSNEIKERIRAGNNAARNPSAAKKMGIDVKNPEATQKQIEDLREELAQLEDPDSETMNRIRERAGLPPLKGEVEAEAETQPEDPNQGGLFGDDTFNLSGQVQGETEADLQAERNRREAESNQEQMFGTDEVRGVKPKPAPKKKLSAAEQKAKDDLADVFSDLEDLAGTPPERPKRKLPKRPDIDKPFEAARKARENGQDEKAAWDQAMARYDAAEKRYKERLAKWVEDAPRVFGWSWKADSFRGEFDRALVVSPDPKGGWRYTNFDRGFLDPKDEWIPSGHYEHKTKLAAVEDAIQEYIRPNAELLDGLAFSPPDRQFSKVIPAAKFPALAKAAQSFVEAELNTPEKFAAFIEEQFGGKLRPYSQSIWNFIMSADETAAQTPQPDWSGVYSGLANQSETKISDGKGRSTIQRSKPKSRLVFSNPIVGPSGSRLLAYEWQFQLEEDVDNLGEEVVRRVSDWSKAEASDATGREIVHQFVVQDNAGNEKIVSAESALQELGFLKRSEGTATKSKMNQVKNLAKLQMELAEVEQRESFNQNIRDELNPVVDAMEVPEVQISDDGKITVGDVVQPGFVLKGNGVEYATNLAVNRWKSNRFNEQLSERGLEFLPESPVAKANLIEKIKKLKDKLGIDEVALTETDQESTQEPQPAEKVEPSPEPEIAAQAQESPQESTESPQVAEEAAPETPTDGRLTKANVTQTAVLPDGSLGFITSVKGDTVTVLSDGITKRINQAETPIKLTDSSKRRRSVSGAVALAAGGQTSIDDFVPDPDEHSAEEIKLFEKSKELIKKHGGQRRIMEGRNPKGTLGVSYNHTGNIAIAALNNIGVAAHETAHNVDRDTGLTLKTMRKVGTTKNGNPKYDPATLPERRELTKVYTEYYPGGKKTDSLHTRMIEGYATFVQKFVEDPKTMRARFPELTKMLTHRDGKYFSERTAALIKDAREIVNAYSKLDPLQKIGSRITNSQTKKQRKWLSTRDKVETFMFDRIWPVEKVAEINGVQMTENDPSVYLREYERTNRVFSHNIQENFFGGESFLAWRDNEYREIHDFNWSTLLKSLKDGKAEDHFDQYLVARRTQADYRKLDGIKEEIDSVTAEIDAIEEGETVPRELTERLSELNGNFRKLSGILENNKISRDLADQSVDQAKSTLPEIARYEQMFDTLVRADLDSLKESGIISEEDHARYANEDGYATFKRDVYDDLINPETGRASSSNVTSKSVSVLKRRTGSEKAIISPLYSSIANHNEILHKSMRQVIWNKLADLVDMNPELMGDIMQREKLEVSFSPETGTAFYPQDSDNNVLMARRNGKRVPYAIDSDLKSVLDTILTPEAFGVLSRILVAPTRAFTKGTTALYPGFAAMNLVVDQITATAQSRTGYVPVVSQIKQLGKALGSDSSPESQFIREYMNLAGATQTMTGWNELPPDKAKRMIAKEVGALKKLRKGLEMGGTIAGLPSQSSEIFTRASEYMNARLAGDNQLVALEKAGRVSAPFHHVGSWGLGVGSSQLGRTWVRTLPYFNAALQVNKEYAKAMTTKGRKSRAMAVTAILLSAKVAELIPMMLLASDDQREKYKDVEPDYFARYIFLPHWNGKDLLRFRVPEQMTMLASPINMALQNAMMDNNFDRGDMKDAAMAWVPDQFDPSEPTRFFLSFLPHVSKVTAETAMNKRTWPKIRDLEPDYMTKGRNAKLPQNRTFKTTSAVAKELGELTGLSPIKIDHFMEGMLGRSIKMVTKTNSEWEKQIRPFEQRYYFTAARNVRDFYEQKEKTQQLYNSVKQREVEVSREHGKQIFKDMQLAKRVDELLKRYRELDEDGLEDSEDAYRLRKDIIEKINMMSPNPLTSPDGEKPQSIKREQATPQASKFSPTPAPKEPNKRSVAQSRPRSPYIPQMPPPRRRPSLPSPMATV